MQGTILALQPITIAQIYVRTRSIQKYYPFRDEEVSPVPENVAGVLAGQRLRLLQVFVGGFEYLNKVPGHDSTCPIRVCGWLTYARLVRRLYVQYVTRWFLVLCPSLGENESQLLIVQPI